MAELFLKQGKEYSSARPTYPKELFHFIASKTPSHDLVWDVGTGTGQAAKSLAETFKNVIATDTSPKQLEFAPRLPNVRYECTPPKMSISEVEQKIAPSSSVDLVTVAQAMHWFDLPLFYEQVKRVLKKPDGVIAAWCYKLPEINQGIDSVMHKFFTVDADPYLEPPVKLIENKYETIDFPFQPVDGLDHTGPLEFKSTMMMNLESYFTYIRSWSGCQTSFSLFSSCAASFLLPCFFRPRGEFQLLLSFLIQVYGARGRGLKFCFVFLSLAVGLCTVVHPYRFYLF